MSRYYGKTVLEILAMNLSVEEERKALEKRYEELCTACFELTRLSSELTGLTKLLVGEGGSAPLILAISNVNDSRRQGMNHLRDGLAEPKLDDYYEEGEPTDENVEKYRKARHEFHIDASRKLEDLLGPLLKNCLRGFLGGYVQQVRVPVGELESMTHLIPSK